MADELERMGRVGRHGWDTWLDDFSCHVSTEAVEAVKAVKAITAYNQVCCGKAENASVQTDIWRSADVESAVIRD
jgi:hypothetical protein